jgi:hypothetical protein
MREAPHRIMCRYVILTCLSFIERNVEDFWQLLQGCEYVCPIIGAMERLNSSFIHVGALEGMAAELT